MLDSAATTSDHDLLIRIRQILDSFIREVENRFAQVQKEHAESCISIKELEQELRTVVKTQADCCTKIAVLESMNHHMEQSLLDMKKNIDDQDADEKTSMGLWIAIVSTIATVIGLVIGFFIPR